MPPRHCLGQLPLRPAALPSPCLARPRFLPSATPIVSFSTSAAKLKNPNQKKGNSSAGPPKKGVKGLRIKKSSSSRDTGKRPAPGERKALRKRIVLSNTNALEVRGLPDLQAEDVGDAAIQGKVVGIPMDPVVDQLRAVDAFKPNQSWGLFRRPAMLARRETVELGRLISAVEAASGNKTAGPPLDATTADSPPTSAVRKIVYGDRASGKTTLLLQAMSMAFLKGWVVINFPDAMELTIGHTAYAALDGETPPQYTQKNYTASLLAQVAKANEKVLGSLKLAHEHTLPVALKGDRLLDLAQLGARDADVAWPVLRAFWKELTTLSNKEKAAEGLTRPPVMVCMDNLSFIMNNSEYIDREAKPIHAHDLVLVRHFVNLLNGTAKLPNGGIVLAATSGSNSPKSNALDFAIERIEAKQNGATGLPLWNPYKKIDERSLKALSNVEILKVKGLTREEARAIIEYYAQSGMMRRTVDENLVSEKWTVSGGGIIGELERATVKYRI
ncbi:mitochondrial ribosomal protein [Diplodia corticola]|uniref:Small ribosomal subunit protein mS29 n=1 Tax=Diplodia corticola TaxID=236234 RepID=A0A1J9QU03_9PEZI|nr:mitochondrial ribosomal protein [Diplodia corticola]OJD32454.1 mitochondrial ribosomal protein [Diplodia corticola]